MQIDGREYLNGREAVEYLSNKWGISYNDRRFRSWLSRLRHEQDIAIEPDIRVQQNASLWLKETLDRIPKPDRSKPRPSRRKAVKEAA